ncbi:SDR family NAD(P)-dependent oxidoreductase [Streptomyces noursei]|uniref:SDR family NAD(P)-dependent oxidoreductase n=2 Tax=Streptomyces noursei TaxID=1971 RepID=UPI0022A6EF23|nr:SDR family NAD(P)-dependent oxidoreductase [Streptomyces noursei]MCZ1012704.1 SDR family NAD(P)-dependent oxidoreductase [Streptomyces noursei]MCZ1021066.1 SDR family NAD(P)-dependent oxidoreductase [Streptomyces noursei]
MSDPVVLITGALTGIGRATALAYARQGANLVVSGRHEDVGEQFARELTDLGAPCQRPCGAPRRRPVVLPAGGRLGVPAGGQLSPRQWLVWIS